MKILVACLLLLLTSSFALGQGTPGTVRFPTDLDTPDSLFRIKDLPRARLMSSITSSSTTITVDSTATFDLSGSIKLDDEVIFYNSKTETQFLGLTRGASGTTAASHAAGIVVRAPVLAVHHNTLAASIIATQTKIGRGSSSPVSGAVFMGTGSGTSQWVTQPVIDCTNCTNVPGGGGGVPPSRNIATLSPLSGGGDLSADRTLGIADAVADGSSKGVASFAAADFNAAAGNISLDYTNGQAADAATKGFLIPADWITFNSKVSPGPINTSGMTMASARLLGRSSASSGAIEEITIGSGLTLAGGSLSATGGGSGSPGGSDTQIQFNDGGAFGGDSGFTFNTSTDRWAVGGASKRIEFGNGGWATYSVPFLRPVDTNRGMAFDLMPNGTLPGGEDVHQDICSTDITADQSNFECLELKKTATYAHIGTKKLGTGTVRNLAINENGGFVGVGFNAPDAPLHVFSATESTVMKIESDNATGYTLATFVGTGRNFATGVGNASETTFSVANKWFVFDATAGAMRLTVDSSGLLSVNGNVTVTGSVTSGTGGSTAGAYDFVEGSAHALVPNTFTIYAPADVAAGGLGYVLPATAGDGFLFATNNSGTMTITHVGSSGSGNVIRSSAVPYDVAFNFVGVPVASDTGRFVAARSSAFETNFTGTVCNAGTAATAQTDFLVKKNGSTVATLRFAAAATTCSIVSPTTTTLGATDIITVEAPASPDATLANIAITLKGNLP